MTSPEIAVWLKSTVPGIVILGAIGSILAFSLLRLAYFLLKLAIAVLRRILPEAIIRILIFIIQMFAFAVRPLVLNAILCRRFIRDGKPAQLVTWVATMAAFLAADVVLFGVCLTRRLSWPFTLLSWPEDS